MQYKEAYINGPGTRELAESDSLQVIGGVELADVDDGAVGFFTIVVQGLGPGRSRLMLRFNAETEPPELNRHNPIHDIPPGAYVSIPMMGAREPDEGNVHFTIYATVSGSPVLFHFGGGSEDPDQSYGATPKSKAVIFIGIASV